MRLYAQVRRSFMIAASAVLLGAAQLAQSAPLNLTLADAPDIVSQFLSVAYDADTNQFLASGFAFELDNVEGDPPTGVAIQDGTFDLSAEINNAGALVSGSLTIQGGIADLGINPGTVLLTGDLTNFGFSGASDIVEFTFDAVGGAVANLFDVSGGLGGTILSQLIGLTDDIINDGYDSAAAGATFAQADTAAIAPSTPVPEPMSLSLLLSGGLLLAVTVYQRRA